MRALLQRVSTASVTVGGECVADIGQGLLVLLGLDKGDDQAAAERMLDKLLAYRVFADAEGRMRIARSQGHDSEGSLRRSITKGN